MLLELHEAKVDGSSIHFLEFSKGKLVIQTSIAGTIINSIVDTPAKDKLLSWKKQITNHIYSERQSKEDSRKHYAISVGMRFYPQKHGNSCLDIENYIKPILDGIAKGLFCESEALKIDKFNFDDSNFIHLYIERLPDSKTQNEEGIVITVSQTS
jgi:hypothetical protein